MLELRYTLERSVFIQAIPETVFRYFTDSARWASWWGAGSTIDPAPGGKVYIRYPNGIEAAGEFIEAQPPRRVVFTFGYASGKPMAPGSSRITITLEPQGSGTLLRLLHELGDAEARDQHIGGWRYQLSVFANVVANQIFANIADGVDAWFDAWAIQDESSRAAALASIVTSGIHFRDRYAAIQGLADLTAHAGAFQRFMPNIRMVRNGDIRHCQGMVLADWNAEGQAGTNVFVFEPNGRIESVTGFTRTN